MCKKKRAFGQSRQDARFFCEIIAIPTIIIPYHVIFSLLEQIDFFEVPVFADIPVPMPDERKHQDLPH